MAQITIKINGYAYTVGCEDGQEAHLQAMAGEIEKRVNSIRALGGQSGEARLLVLAALLMADELHDLNVDMQNLRSEAGLAAMGGAPAGDPHLAETLARLADKAEEIASSLEHP